MAGRQAPRSRGAFLHWSPVLRVGVFAPSYPLERTLKPATLAPRTLRRPSSRGFPPMRFTVLVAVALASALLPVSAMAQVADTTRGAVLTLDEAIALAQRNNPQHLQLVNDRRAANAAVRAAYGAFLPSARISLSGEYRKEGSQPLQGLTFSTSSDIYQSSYWLGLNYDISPATFITP